jgi:hypothetical protein
MERTKKTNLQIILIVDGECIYNSNKIFKLIENYKKNSKLKIYTIGLFNL